MNKKNKIIAFGLGVTLTTSTAFAGLAISPGVTTDILDDIDKVQDEELREMLKTAVWPGFGERHMNLDRPDDQLSEFEKNYKQHPLTWDEKIENVKYILEQGDDPSELTRDNVEYKDIVFGEAVIPVADRRVVEILDQFYLEDELERLDQEKQEAIAALYTAENVDDVGAALQTIEDEYAAKLAILMEAENEYKEAKIDFLKLENQNKYGRIDDETFQARTLEVIDDFESFFVIGSNTPLFDEQKIKQLASSIYDDSIIINQPKSETDKTIKTINESPKYVYWILSSIFMLLALLLGFLGFKRLKK